MVWWWIGNVVLLIVVAPVVVLLLHRLMRPVREIRDYADDILEHAGLALEELGAAEGLAETRSLVAQAGVGVQGYATAVDDLISS
jgi:hypothetical protein